MTRTRNKVPKNQLLDEFIKRLWSFYGVKKAEELAKKFGRAKVKDATGEFPFLISGGTISDWQTKATNFPRELIDHIYDHRISFDMLFYGHEYAMDRETDWTAPHDPSDETICKARSILTGPDENRAHALKSIIDDMARAAAEEKPHAKKKHKPLRKAKC